jgi:hypothetical protein
MLLNFTLCACVRLQLGLLPSFLRSLPLSRPLLFLLHLQLRQPGIRRLIQLETRPLQACKMTSLIEWHTFSSKIFRAIRRLSSLERVA